MRISRSLAFIATAATAAVVLAGCSGSTEPAASEDPASDVITVGALTPGNANDGAFNQALADALAQLEEEGLITYELREQMGRLRQPGCRPDHRPRYRAR